MKLRRLGLVLLVVVVVAITAVAAFERLPQHARGGYAQKEFEERFDASPTKQKAEDMYFQQISDHFQPVQPSNTFQQRTFSNNTFWNGTGPVFFYLCGEAPCQSPFGGYPAVLAKKYQALLVSLEHRFYGKSIPNNNFSVDNMKLLTVEQVLADYEYFISTSEAEYSKQYGKIHDWVIIGGSYSGALSAWFKETTKLPFVKAAWSSSGVVNAILNFTGFDTDIRLAAGPDCGAALMNATTAMEQALKSGDNIKPIFNSPANLSDPDFFYMAADGAAMAIQYGFKADLCNAMLAAGDPITKLSAFIKQLWGEDFGNSCFYNTECLKTDTSMDRSWRWQKCYELAYFQTAPDISIRSKILTLPTLLQQCINVFGNGILPNTSRFNAAFGGALPYATATIYVDASDDPWKAASVQFPVNANPYLFVNCSGCGHCIDLYSPRDTDPEILTHVRQQIDLYLTEFLQQ